MANIHSILLNRRGRSRVYKDLGSSIIPMVLPVLLAFWCVLILMNLRAGLSPWNLDLWSYHGDFQVWTHVSWGNRLQAYGIGALMLPVYFFIRFDKLKVLWITAGIYAVVTVIMVFVGH